jgi:hypothetical protein
MEDLFVFGAMNPEAFLGDPRVRLLMATTPGWIMQLPANTLQAIVRCRGCPAGLLRRLPRERGLPILARMEAAGRPDFPANQLRLFMRHAAIVRVRLANNPALPLDLEGLLSYDRCADVRAAIARRTENLQILNRLAHDRSLQKVRVAAAHNPALPVMARAYLSNSKMKQIQDGLKKSQRFGRGL